MIKKNDIIDIVSPGTACSLAEILEIENYVKKIGLKSRIFLHDETAMNKSASSEFAGIAPKKRFEQFKKSVESKDSKIIWCTRGGYGSAEILQFLEKLPKPKTKKILIGFSDITSLNKLLIEKWNWQIVSAPMLIQLASNTVSKKAEKGILDLIFGKNSELKYQLTALSAKKSAVVAPIVGGCLSVLCGHFGTKNNLNWQGKILFLEDEGETGERLDRYFSQLLTIIGETKKIPAAILLGNFLQANLHGTPKAKNVEIAIEKFAKNLAEKKLSIPLFVEKTKCLGHSKDMLPLVLGSEAKIDKNLQLTQIL
jgi:muramoyltetrapeptide carboxypeptidase